MSKNPSNRKLNAALRDGQTNTPKSGRTALGSLTLAALWTMAAQASQLPRQDRQQAEAEGESPEQLQHSAQETAQATLTSAEGPGLAGKEAASTGGKHAIESTLEALVEGLQAESVERSSVNNATQTALAAPAASEKLQRESDSGPTMGAPDAANSTSTESGGGASGSATAAVDTTSSTLNSTQTWTVAAAPNPAEAVSPIGSTAATGSSSAGAAPAAAAGLSMPTLIGAVAGISAMAGLGGGGLTVATPSPAPAPGPTAAPPAPAAPQPLSFNAKVVDGYVKGATVFYDADADGVLDAGEVSTVTDENGNFQLTGVTPSSNGRIVVLEGGTDIETGNPVGRLMASGDPTVKVVSPLTLVLALNPDLTEKELKVALGLPENLDIETFDPIAAMDRGDASQAALGQTVFSVQQQVLAVVQAVAVVAGQGDATASSLTQAVAAMGAALKDSAASIGTSAPAPLSDRLGSIVTDTLQNAEADETSLASMKQMVLASATAVADAYESTTGDMALWQARRVAANPGAASQADRAAALEQLAEAKAAASASQTLLLTAMEDVAKGSITAAAAAAAFDNDLGSSIEEQKSDYKDRLSMDAGQDLLVDGLPAFLVADLPGSANTTAKAVLDYATAVEAITLSDLAAQNVRVVKLVGANKTLSLSIGSLQGFEGQELSSDLFADGDIAEGSTSPGPDYVVTLRVANADELEEVVANAQTLVNAGIDKLSLTAAGLALTSAQAAAVEDAGLKVEGAQASNRVRVTFEVDDTSNYTLGNPTGQLDYDFGGAGSSIAVNPPTGSSGRVAQIVKSAGAQTWAGTTFLSLPTGELATAEKPLVTMRVWSPEAGTKVLLKLETLDNPPGGPKFAEVQATTTVAGAWQTLSFDFSNANHTLGLAKASVFFDFGTAGSGKTFYLDNVTFLNEGSGTPPPPPPAPPPAPTTVTVSFDAGGTSGYTLGRPDGQPDSDFGGAGSSIAQNPPQGASGAVAQVVKSTGAETWAGTTFLSLPAGELITPSSQTATMRVWSPEAGTIVRLKLEDSTDGTKTVETNATTTTQANTWQTLTFNFANPASGTNPLNHANTFNKASVFFDFGTPGSGKTFYFDDVKFLDAVAPPPPPELTDLQLFSSTAASEDFASQFTGVETFGNGATFNFATADDPHDVYARVGSVVSGEGYGNDINVAFAAFTALGAGFADGYEAFSIKVANTPNGRLEVKLIGGGADSVANIELATYAGATNLGNGWFNVAIAFTDFTNPANIANHSGYLIGMPGDNGANQFTFYFTDIELLAQVPTPEPNPTRPINVTFESIDATGFTLGHPQGQPDSDFGGAGSSIATNPPQGASGAVAQVVKVNGALTYAGTTFLSLPSGELATAEKPLVTMRVWSPEAGTKVLLKLETLDNAPGGPNNAEVEATTTVAGAWQTLSFDFSGANHALSLAKASVFFDFGTTGSGKTFYFDNVSFLNSANALATPGTLVFSDEFGGAVHDGASAAAAPAAHWTRETGTGNNGWGNNELQVYTNNLSNAFVEDGTLHIVANKTGSSITSARLKSDLPDLDPYGYMEIRAKLPSELGAWPAIWLLGNGTWPDTGEIDIVEWASMFSDTKAQAALHFKGDNNQTVKTYGDTSYKASTTLSSIIDTFHTYQLWWTPESIRIGVDGNVNTAHFEYLKPGNATTSWWPFGNAMDIILNLAIGGTMGGAVPGDDFQYTMEVDYVRVYQQGTSFDAGQVLSAAAGGNNAALLQSVAGAATAYTEIDLGHVQALVSSSGAQTLGEVDGLLTSSTTGALPRLASAGIDVLELDEALVDALGSADIDLDASPLGSALQVTARPDAGEGTTAYLQASLLDLQKVGIDRVLTPDVTQAVVIALRDSGDSASLPSTTGGPFFVHRADQTVTVLLDQDDLTALLGQTGALDALAASGVTHLKTDTSVTAEGLQALSAALASGSLGLENTSALNPAELALLGLGIPPENPFGLPPL